MKKFFYLLIVSCIFILTPKDSIAQNPQPFAAGEILINSAPIGASEACGDLHRYEVILKYYRDDGGAAAQFPAPVVTFVNTRIMKDNPPPIIIPQVMAEGFESVTLTLMDDRGAVDNECIQGDPIITLGKWYSGFVFIPESETPWTVYYGNVRDVLILQNGVPNRVPQPRGDLVQSPENHNIEEGQRYTLRTDFKVVCEEVVTGAGDVPPKVTVVNPHYNNETAELLTEDLVQTFCHGQDYEFQIPIKDYDNPPFDLNLNGKIDPGETLGKDSLHFELTSALKGTSPVLYASPYASTNPVPVELGTKMDISKDGFITFKPRLEQGVNAFFGVVTIRVSEYRRRVVSVPKNFGGGAAYDSLALEYDPEPIAVTYRQFRYIIDRKCNKNLPKFTRDQHHWNDVEQAWEFDCASSEFIFDLSFPMYEHSLKRGGVNNDDHLDIRIIRGSARNPQSDDAEPVFDIIPIDQSALELELGEFSKFKIVTKKTLGPGNYNFYFKLGVDQNTLINRCGFQVPEYDSIPVFINGDFEYDYFDRDAPIDICYPQSDVKFYPLIGQPNVKFGDEFEFKFHYIENRPAPPAVEWDTSFTSFYKGRRSDENTYTDTIRDDENTGLPILKEGRWRVQVGRVYRYEFENVIYRSETCYQHDDVFVNIFENAPIVPRKWDLCPGEDWPVINLDTMSTIHKAQDFLWGYETKKEENVTTTCKAIYHTDPDTIIFPCLKTFYRETIEIQDTTFKEVNGELIPASLTIKGVRHVRDEEGNILLDTIPVGGSGNSRFPLSSVAFGNEGTFLIESVVQLENGECFATTHFEIRKGPVEVDLGHNGESLSDDTTICPGQQFLLEDLIDHHTPDSIFYVWSLNGSVILDGLDNPNENSRSLQITEEGEYNLTTYKKSELDKNGNPVICFGEDIINVRIADDLTPPLPVCSKVTFKDGAVQQTFFWPELKGADAYQVKFITPNIIGDPDTSDWIDPNGDYNLLHKTSGREIELIARAVNLEVPENSICRFGPISYAAAPCEVIVKPVNIFTPNGDGINDVLRFDLLEIYIGNKLQIFNRWGELMYEDNDYLNDWDGGDLKDGTYFYILHVGDDNKTLLKGNVTIVR